ncbi:putative peptide modification target (TIGR04139 family) [Chryseobacterium sp. 52]|uniref:grasp-with-spasm system A modified peptide n=1 Tax=Chryseobacterium sp. 52 TaxID=2035213 RepID=UPI000C18960C|nr:grasp-with-spasm system A modified peptide [Chryseobacterium sp. 52]PIF44503.1 putative peptide modification target (TIGR04139 family) [Chryseobacterium sp. 52]
MKKLNGMKGNFSSLENKKLKNLHVISGGSASNRNSPSQYTTPEGPVSDTDFYTDDVTTGTWVYKSRITVTVGPVTPTDEY